MEESIHAAQCHRLPLSHAASVSLWVIAFMRNAHSGKRTRTKTAAYHNTPLRCTLTIACTLTVFGATTLSDNASAIESECPHEVAVEIPVTNEFKVTSFGD
eukprot:gnl/MRDRNA2_/MRDRNA2_157284_c0_seq1.p1 gnl/MRDRNA2_/MRDRNA2_157284_c0~~gnl/MRDRNA2_/MRDRNA2_157284_c0_seq1.p1  ORF type:complete len:101 (+),score=6.05 gnl/MRDRNA2_/MRDRNA2_157284_c0_seq1:3-305(+)